MIKTRLVGLLSHAKKYIVYTILWQWAALLSQVIAVFTIADLLERVVYGAVTATAVKRTVFMLAIVVVIRFFCERMGARSSYLACVDVKRILREKIYEKMLKLGASYSEQVSSSEVVQVSTEGVEQLETYFGKPFIRQCVANRKILQSAISQVLQIFSINHCQFTITTESHISSGTWEISICIFFTPYLTHKVGRNKTSVWSGIRSPKHGRFSTRIPVLFANALKKN